MGPSAGGSRVADYSTLVPPLGRRGGAVGPSAGGGVVDYITMVPPERRRTGGNCQEPSGNGERRANQSDRKGNERPGTERVLGTESMSSDMNGLCIDFQHLVTSCTSK